MEDGAFMMLSDEMIYMEVARKGYSMGIIQPFATLLAYGFRRYIIHCQYFHIGLRITLSAILTIWFSKNYNVLCFIFECFVLNL